MIRKMHQQYALTFQHGAGTFGAPQVFSTEHMDLALDEVWHRLLECARREVPEQTFRTWLEPPRAVEVRGSTLIVAAPDQFAAAWNESKHASLLTSLAPIALGEPCAVEFVVDAQSQQRLQMDLFTQPAPAKAGGAISVAVARPMLNAKYTFDNFVVGKSNELAAAAALAVAESPGRVYNPLFIYGVTGIGKTHLMQAIAHTICERSPQTRAAYLGAEQFTNDYVTSIQGRTTHDFRRRYRELDLLLIDDVHFLKGKEGTQEEFFHTFNALYEAGRQIVLTSDRPPGEIAGVEARLVTRFQWGMVADIELPDLELRIAILRKKALQDHLQDAIPEDVLQLIAERVRSSVRELEGCIIKLLAFASLRQQPVTLELATEALRDRLGDQLSTADGDTQKRSGRISIASIQAAVAHVWGISTTALASKSRAREVAIPRQAAMLLSRELLNAHLTEIGSAFGGRDHSTVIHSLERARYLRKNDRLFADRVNSVLLELPQTTSS
jgi:chromosomal replication initiator protein